VHARIARIADAIVIAIELIGVRDLGTVVDLVDHSTAVPIVARAHLCVAEDGVAPDEQKQRPPHDLSYTA
jgi:hypothetical protein